MKKNLTRNALIGLAFIASLVMIYFGINFLKGINVFKNQKQYYARFDDVSKLLISSPVYLKGYQVGLLSNIKMINSDSLQFLVELNFNEDVTITEGSYFEYGIDMFGASTVNLILVPSDKFLQPGDTLTGKREQGLMENVAAVMPKADSLLLKLDSAVYYINRLLSHSMWEKSLNGISSTVEQLNQSSISLNSIINSLEGDLPEITQNLAVLTNDLKTISTDLSQLDLKSTYTNIDETISNLKLLTDKINNDDSSLGLLLNDTSLHDSLTITLDNAARLLEDIRENPDRYLSVRVRLF